MRSLIRPVLTKISLGGIVFLACILASPAHAAIWYVNDASTTGDSFTSAVGNNGNSGLSPGAPKRDLPALMPLVSSGDTVYIDAGTFDSIATVSGSESAVIRVDTNLVWIIGKDSLSTILDPLGSGATSGLFGVFADTQTGITIRDLAVRGAFEGIKFYNVDLSTIAFDSTCLNGLHGIYLRNGCDSNIIANNVADSNAAIGIYLHATSMNNMVMDNRADSNLNYGIYVDSTKYNYFAGNRADSNKIYGFYVATGADNNTFIRNTASQNAGNGIRLWASNGNRFEANTLSANVSWAHYLDGTTADDTYRKNNVSGSAARPDSALYNNTMRVFDFLRNWWGTTDSLYIKSKIRGPGRDSIVYIPFRLGPVDTSPGADTVAPKAPDTVTAVSLATTSIRVSWSPTTLDEEADPNPTNLAGYKIYRSPTAETSVWILRGYANSATLVFDDTGLGLNETWHYKLTAYDNAAPYVNEAWYSESPVVSATVWSVIAQPNVWYVNDTSTSGDSFTSTLGNNANDGLSPATPKRDITAVMPLVTPGDTVFIDAGVYDSIVAAGGSGFTSIRIDTDYVAIIGKDSLATIIDPSGSWQQAGLNAVFADTQQGLLIRGICVRGAYAGINLLDVDLSTIEGNSASGIGLQGIVLRQGSDSNTIRNNISDSNGSSGIVLEANSRFNAILNNRTNRNFNWGINMDNSSFNTITGNVADSNAIYGFYIAPGIGNYIVGNSASYNATNGIRLYQTSANVVQANHQVGNGSWAFYLTNGATGDTVGKNNILGPASSPDSALFNNTLMSHDFRRNWWGTTDSLYIKSKIRGSGRDSIVYMPYRLGPVDSSPGADTVAPRSPDTVAATALSNTAIRLTWAPVANDEEADPFAVNLAGYRIYRSATADTSVWYLRGYSAGATTLFDDTGLSANETWYYRATSYDNGPAYPNESWYSDSIVPATTMPVDVSLPNVWYVNDTSTSGDSFTSAVGNSANNGVTPSTPKRWLNDVENLLSAGDTILVDAGTFFEADTFRIGVNGVFVIGMDSVSTVIDFNDTSASSARSIAAAGVNDLALKNFKIRNGRWGVFLKQVDSSTIQSVAAERSSMDGVYLDTGCDTNVLRDNTADNNGQMGFHLANSDNNTIVDNSASGNIQGFYLEVQSDWNLLRSNRAFRNSNHGICFTSAFNNACVRNDLNNNLQWGVVLVGASAFNRVEQNHIDSNFLSAVYIGNTANNNTVVKNNLLTSPYRPDSAVENATGNGFSLIRNWWGTTDSIAIKAKISGSGRNLVATIPFRLGAFNDTEPSLDTVAPRSPDTAAGFGFDTHTVVITWSIASINEENGLGLADLAGYRVYRARTADSSYWHRLGSVGSHMRYFADSSCQPESTYYYRVTAFDNTWPFDNEGFYSDTIVCVATPGTFLFITKAVLDRVETSTIPIVLRWETFVSDPPDSYRLQIGIDSGFTRLVLETSLPGGTSFAFIPPSDSVNSRFLWRVIASYQSSLFVSPPGAFTIDTTPPTAPVPVVPADSAAVATFLTPFAWLPSADSTPANNTIYSGLGPKIALYRLVVSRNSSFTDTVIDLATTDSGVTPSFIYANGQTYHWKVRALDLAGNGSSYSATRSFTKTQPVDTTPPAQVPGLFAQPLDTGAIRVNWTASPSLSMESGYYRLYWDSGSGGTASTLIETRAHVAGAAYSYLSAVLANGVTYTFKVQAVSGAGIADSGLAVVKATARLASNSAPEMRWITPRSEKQNVNKTGVVHCEVGPITSSDPDLANLGKVRFQYRAAASSTFTDMALANSDKEANPENYRGSGNIGINWLASGLADGQYELRAIPILGTGPQVDANAVYVTIQLTGNSSDAHDSTSHDNASNKTTHEEKLLGNSDTISATLPTKEKTNIVLDSSAIPLNSSGQAPKLLIAISNILPQDSALPDSTKTCGPVVDVKFSTLEQPKGDVTIEISLPPLDNRGRALVGNRKIPLNQLKCYRHNGTSWLELTNFTIDTAAGVIRIRSSNFSLFRAAAPESNLVPALTPPPLDSPAATFRTRSNSLTIRWQPSQDEDTTTVRYRLQFSTSPTFATLTYDSTEIVETGAAVNLPANTPLYWRVISSNSQGDTQISSSTRTVIIDTAPPLVAAVSYPSETYPKIAARNSTRLSWNASSDSDYVDSYRVQLWRTDTNGAPIADSALTSAQLQAAVAQLSPDTYVWRLWAADAVANQQNSGYKTFRVFRNGDVTEDGSVNAEDYFSVGRSFGGTPSSIPLGDMDQDGDIDMEDVRIILGP
ncbi:MAG: NosD domain-containing protein [Candidatus Hydrogenedentota bacterium]